MLSPKLGRAPRGARGLKSMTGAIPVVAYGRAPRGARGLKFLELVYRRLRALRRAPRGARGLKFLDVLSLLVHFQSCPSRGTWLIVIVPMQKRKVRKQLLSRCRLF